MEKGKGKGRWKEDSLRNVGRTHARTHGRTDGRTQRRFYTLSNAMHCIGQTIITNRKEIAYALLDKTEIIDLELR